MVDLRGAIGDHEICGVNVMYECRSEVDGSSTGVCNFFLRPAVIQQCLPPAGS